MSLTPQNCQDEQDIWDAQQLLVLDMLEKIEPKIAYGLLDELSRQTDFPDNAELSSEAGVQRSASALRSLPDVFLAVVAVVAQASLGQLLNMLQIEAHERRKSEN